MDHVNRWDSVATYRLIRLEYAVALVICLVLGLIHIRSVYWPTAVLLFVYIDVIGYLPGAVAYRRAGGREISRVYYVLYNTMHSLVTQAAVLGVWILLFGWGWAMLVVPIHLCGDRALFGNFLKPFTVPFEPKATPAWIEFQRRLRESGQDRAPAAALR
ncbi:hypothetical protein [Nocardia aurantia]|uniref:Integral membrane protein n=1 Tax=Nocardia aurantia TaxID=2585199 RepID=A0A7K0DNM6_9NOCA|nr:hypothetical protein [Nocardia aurantia]MQY26404.1 hypothetical protein [Nocardia aurantia]